jgi:hypothetical protein
MQIEIKTLQNIRDSRVKLEIILDETESSGIKPLYRAAVDAETELVAVQARVVELEVTENALRNRITNLLTDRAEETKRADLNKEWAERAEARLTEVEKIVSSQDVIVALAMSPVSPAKHSAVLADAVKRVREALTLQ